MHLLATNPMIYSASVLSPTAEFTLPFEKSAIDLKANSHIPCRAHAALIHTCRAASHAMPCRVLRESLRGSRKNPNWYSNGLREPRFKCVATRLDSHHHG
jgi:hypothetical protein